jgi:hypothetical protein
LPGFGSRDGTPASGITRVFSPGARQRNWAMAITHERDRWCG